MSSSPSDEWLLAVLDEKSPEEFTPAELAALWERAAHSPEVRRAIAERVRLEEALHATLGAPVVTAESIIRRASARRRRRLAAAGVMALLLAITGGFWWLANRPKAPPAEVVAGRPDDPSEEPEAADARPVIVPVEAVRPQATVPTVAAEPAVSPPEPKPWDAALGDDAPVVPFAESAFAPFGETVPGFEVADEFPAAELNRWIDRVPGQPFNVNEGQVRGKRFAGLEGIAKLLPPWREDAVLRIAAFDIGELALHFWNGNEGVTLRFHPHQRPQLLAAYAVTRDGKNPSPKAYRLVATDGGRYARTNAGAIEVRHQDGSLVVTRGAVPLLVVPGAAMPQEVFLEGRMRLRTLTMYRGEPAPLPSVATRRDLFADASPDKLDWITSDEPGVKFETADGRVTLVSDGSALDRPRQMAWAAVRLPEGTAGGLCETVFRIDALTPGTGLYLGDAEGRPVHTLFASENTAGTPMLAYGWTSRDGNVPEPRWQWNVDPKQELAPAVGPGTWVKLIVGPGGLKTFVSGDGEHWGPAARSPQRNVRGPFASVGLFTFTDDTPRSIGVSAVTVRELSGLASAADPELRGRVPAFGPTPPERPADWLTWVTATRPEDVPLDAWLRTCGVETLARGASDGVIRTVLDGLIRDAIDSGRPVGEVLALIHDAALVSDLWNDQARSLADHYERLARRVAGRRDSPAAVATDLAAIAEGYLDSPIWTESKPWAMPPAVARNVAAAAAWSLDRDAAEAARRVAAYLAPAHPDGGWATDEEAGLARLAAWGAHSAAGGTERPGVAAGFAWHHPLTTEPGREAATLAAELDAALSAGAYEDAARLLAAIDESPGLVPAIGDPGRYVPAAGLIAEAAERHPALVTMLTERFGPAGTLHVRQAIAAGDEEAVRSAAVRFFGTPAAAEARRWLGETALAEGRFAEAESHFAAARSAVPEKDRNALDARQRLAAALAGSEAAEPPTAPVAFGPRTLEPAAFERLVGELRKARSDDIAAERPAATQVPKAVPLTAQARGRFEGDVGRNPGRGEFRRFDWAGRQIGVTLDRGIAYLTNRFQVVAFDPKRKAAWWTVGVGPEQGEAHALPNVAFEPLPRGDRLYVRRLVGRAPHLACLSITGGGKLIWKSESAVAVASDPVFVGDRLIAVTYATGARSGGPYTMSLTRLRTDDGSVLASVPLVVLNDVGQEKPSANLVPTGDGFLMATWGTVLRCDAAGDPVWVRRLPHLPANADPDADRLPPDPPRLVGDRVYLAPPGGRAVICLDAATGRLLWTRPLGELERLHGSAGPVLVARSNDTLLGLDLQTGATKWTFRRATLLEGFLSDETTLLATARTELEDRQDGLSLLRIDAATGRLRSERVVRVQREDEIRCGPLFVHEGTVWAFVGEGWRDPKRTLVEFTPDASLPPVGPAADAGSLDDWIAHVEPQTAFNTAAVLPGWSAVGTQPGKGATFRDEHRGEKWVLVTQAGKDRAARFVRRVKVPSGKPKLVARVGREDDEGWTLRLLADGEPLASEPVNKQTAPDGWRTVTFDLSRLAGKNVTLALDQAPPAEKPNKATKAYWKRVAIE